MVVTLPEANQYLKRLILFVVLALRLAMNVLMSIGFRPDSSPGLDPTIAPTRTLEAGERVLPDQERPFWMKSGLGELAMRMGLPASGLLLTAGV